MAHRARCTLVALLALTAVQCTQAAITVDPQNTGATDVTSTLSPFPTVQIQNPVSNPLNLFGRTLQVGNTNPGALAITAGGQVSGAGGRLGQSNVAGSTIRGDVVVDGPGSSWTMSSTLLISNGTISVTGGAQLSSTTARIGNYNTDQLADVLIDGPNSRWTVNGSLYVADREEGSLTVSNGATLSSGSTFIGTSSGGAAEVTIGPNAIWTIGGVLYVGSSGLGALTIDQSTVSATGSLVLNSGNNGSAIHLNQATLNVFDLKTGAVDLTGTGDIYTGGLISDVDLIFDATHPLQQTFTLPGAPPNSVTIHLDQSRQGALGAGWKAAGTLRIADGMTVHSTEGRLGELFGSSGAATVTGTPSKWIIDKDLSVGTSGIGRLSIAQGGAVEVAGATTLAGAAGSQIEFDGATLRTHGLSADSRNLVGTGDIYNDGSLTIDADLVFDQNHPTSAPIVIADQPGQNITIHQQPLTNSNLGVGYRRAASLRIADGQQVATRSANIGALGAPAVATVTGAGSALNATSTITVAPGSQFNVLNGATVSGFGRISASPGNNSQVTIDGAGSSWTMIEIFSMSAIHSTCTMNITNGGHLTSPTTSIGASNDLSLNSIVNMSGAGSQWELNGALQVASGGRINLAGGTLDLNGRDLLIVGYTNPAYPTSAERFVFTGGILTDVRTFSGHLVQAGGRLEIGTAQIDMNVSGNYSLDANSTLAVDVSGTSPANIEMLKVTGSATLSGALSISFANNFNPVAGNSFDVLNFGSLSGTFNSLSLPALDTGLMWNATQLYTTGILSVNILGDYSGDGVVDTADYITLRKSGATSSNYDVWRSHFGQTAGSGSSLPSADPLLAAVPEPASVTLWVFAAAGWYLRRGRTVR